MKKAVEKKLARRVIPKKKLLKKKAAPNKKELKTKAGDKKTAGGKTAGPLKKQVRGKAKAWIRWHSHWRNRERSQASNRKICRIIQRRRCGFRKCG
jgi:hypothetical protein